MIEARIVSLASEFRRELGITWSGNFNVDPQHGNATGARWPYTINSVTNFGVNFPAIEPVGTTGLIRFGSIDDVLTIFARIDAAEEDNKAKTLSQPKIFTQDNVAASVVSQQVRTRVQVVGDNITTETAQAPLALSVTPRISSDGFVTMTVDVNNASFVSPDLQELATVSQSINSQVTVRDGETVVIGGIFETEEVDNFNAVPGLHRIPVVGWLFKSTAPKAKLQRELLVFLTPTILDRQYLQPEQEGTDVSLSY
jgi:type IV pilus assembly protein PilQ